LAVHGYGSHRPQAGVLLTPIKKFERGHLSASDHPPDANCFNLDGWGTNFSLTGYGEMLQSVTGSWHAGGD